MSRIRSIIVLATVGWLTACAAMQPLDSSAAELQNSLLLDSELADRNLTVQQFDDGSVEVGGFVESLEELESVRELIEDAEGLDNIRNSVIVASNPS